MKSKKATAESVMLLRIAALAPHLSAFQGRAVALAVEVMFENSFFSICSFDSLATSLGRSGRMNKGDHQALHDLHCVRWEKMGKAMASETREKCLALLGLTPEEAGENTGDERAANEQAKALIRRLRA